MSAGRDGNTLPVFPLQSFTPEHHVKLLKLLGSADVVQRVRIECSTWAWLDANPDPAQRRPDMKAARNELRTLDRKLTRLLADLRHLSETAADRIYGEAYRLQVHPPSILETTVSQVSVLRNCVKAAEAGASKSIELARHGPQSPREHRLISMVLRVLPSTIARSTASGSKLVRILTVLYAAVGLPLSEDDEAQWPRDHIRSYINAYSGAALGPSPEWP